MKGIGASPGIAIGRVLVKDEKDLIIERSNIQSSQQEVERLGQARELAKSQVKKLHDIALNSMGANEAHIFEAHMMIIDDPEFFNQVETKIADENINAEYALNEVSKSFINIFENMDNEYMRERASDIKDVTGRVMKNLLGIDIVDFANLEHEAIIVARDLTPSDTASMNRDKVIGFITEIGGKTSHSAIMARTLELPAVVGLDEILSTVKNNDLIVFDGETGEVHVNPSDDIIEQAKDKKREYQQYKEILEKFVGKPSVSKDGVKVELAANIGTPSDLEGVLKNDSEGIGLYRTEFLYMDRDKMPTEEEQFNSYKEVLEGMEGKPVVIRTLDIGGDKKLDYLKLPEEMNPFLGYRAIRICLDRKDIFKTQLRALYRASIFGNLKIMFPMISSIEELRSAKLVVEEVKEELRNKNIEFSEKVELGMMIEIPATAIISDMLAKEVDFFSIGTNDLIQYTTAVDRMNQKISHLYNQFHPALLRLIKMTIENGHKEGKWVGMCGEVAGDPKLIPILLGFGLDEFSMSPMSVLRARYILSKISREEMKEHAQKVVMLPTAEDVKKYIEENIKY